MLGLLRLGFCQEPIHGGQCVGVLLEAELDDGLVVHGGVVAVVVEAVRFHRLAEVVGGLGLVVEVGRGIARQRIREGFVVGIGGRHRSDLLRLRHHPGHVLLLELLLQRLQVLDHLAAGLGVRRRTGGIRIQRGLVLGLLGLVLALAQLRHAFGALFAHRLGAGGRGGILLRVRGRDDGKCQHGGNRCGKRAVERQLHGQTSNEDGVGNVKPGSHPSRKPPG